MTKNDILDLFNSFKDSDAKDDKTGPLFGLEILADYIKDKCLITEATLDEICSVTVDDLIKYKVPREVIVMLAEHGWRIRDRFSSNFVSFYSPTPTLYRYV